MYALRSDRPSFSALYSLSHYGLFYTLTSVLTSPLPTVTITVTTSTTIPSNRSILETSVSTESTSNSTPLDPLLFVQAALTSSKLLVATSEDESRDINVTKAELFGGLLRGFLVLYDEQLKNIPQGPSTKRDQIENDALRMETLLVSYFSEIVEKLSVDYLKDWAEAVFHIFTCGLCKLSNPLSCFILDGFRRVLRISTVSSTIVSVNSVSTSSIIEGMVDVIGLEMEEITEETVIVKEKDNAEEGFVRQGKALTLTRAALTGEITAASSYINTDSAQLESSLGFGRLVAKIICEPDSDFFSPFVICRLEIGKIFSLLSENGPSHGVDLSPVLQKISDAVNAGVGIPQSDDISMDVANVAIVDTSGDTGEMSLD